MRTKIRTSDAPLANLLFGQTRGRILATLYGNPDEAFFVRQIARSVEVTLDQLLERLTPLERTLGRPVNPTVYSSEEMRAKLKAGNHFLKAIQKGKNTFLIGDEHEFRKLL
jgi:hypothetical protein